MRPRDVGRLRARLAAAVLVASVLAPTPGIAQETETRCAPSAAPEVEAGWVAYRAGDFVLADDRFAVAARCPDLREAARIGLGYVALRTDRLDVASEIFAGITAAADAPPDAWFGSALVAWREGDGERVEHAVTRVLELAPDHEGALDLLRRLHPPAYEPAHDPGAPPAAARPLVARVAESGFEIRTREGWRSFYVRGVNLGAALPGRHPSEFPDSTVYAGWIDGMAGMGANAIRVYTIHPPAFYEALLDYNSAAAEPLWLIHGVWAELPPEDDFADPKWETAFFSEMRRVVDLLHGAADLVERPGHASGRYRADVSDWTLAYIIGREWEPFSVEQFNALHPELRRFDGRYLRLESGTPMDAWLARATDEMIAYEMDAFGTQRPMAYTNWPTTDPLTHETETTKAEEMAIRVALGETVERLPREYDNDGVSLDATLVAPTAAFTAGYFASYHAYPYYPDFMNLDPGYAEARSPWGPSSYFGYLTELKRYHGDMAVLISEYGVPTGRAIAHFQNQGWDHGGLGEREMGTIDARLTREIAASGMAGGAVFAWIDEWFKKNWLTIDFEIPLDRNRMWLNRFDAEQHYGMIAMEPGPVLPGETLSERLVAWRERPELYADAAGSLRATQDEAGLWLLVDCGPAADAAGCAETFIGFDTVDPAAGDARWPDGRGPAIPVGVERVLHVGPDRVSMLVDPPSNPWAVVPLRRGIADNSREAPFASREDDRMFTGRVAVEYRRPVRTVANADGRYDSLRVVINRARFGRDGTEYRATGYDLGVMREGAAPDGDWETATRGDRRYLEVRIPWLLLGVTDPSARRVLQDPAAGDGPPIAAAGFGTVTVDGIRIVVARRHAEGTEHVSWDAWPASGNAADVAEFAWPTWEKPSWSARRRPAFEAMRAAFEDIETGLLAGAGSWSPDAVESSSPTPAPRPDAEQASDRGADWLPEADSAWRAGEAGTASRLYARRVAEAPTDTRALHRLALLRAWDERYAESLALLERMLALDPANLEAAHDRAEILSWAGRLDDAWAAYDSLYRADPSDREAAFGRARILAWQGKLAEAESEYGRLAWEYSADPEASAEYARMAAWDGRLAEAELRWREAIASHPTAVEPIVGLSQTQRWQGRSWEAAGTIRQAATMSPAHPDVIAEGEFQRAWRGPAAAPRLSYEWDAEGNRLVTAGVRGTLRAPSAGLGLHVEFRVREARERGFDEAARAFDGRLGLEVPIGNGWLLQGEGGLTEARARVEHSTGAVALRLDSPAGRRFGGALSLRREAQTGSVRLIGLGVVAESAKLDLWLRPASEWELTTSLEGGTFSATESNRRLAGSLSAMRRLGRAVSTGLSVRAYGFEKNLADGYFDPDFYGLAEIPVVWSRKFGSLALFGRAGAGVQMIGAGGPLSGAVRGRADLTRSFGPGREIGFGGGVSRTGLQNTAAGSDYWYASVELHGSWAF